MVQRVKTLFVSDLSGQELGDAGQTVKFGFSGVEYEIDLSEEEADEFAGVMNRYLSAGRRVAGRRQRGSAASGRRPGELASIRSWARENGYQVSDRGRVSQQIVDAYQAAN